MIYLDNAATTSVCRAAADRVHELLLHCFGNPSSLHRLGLDASRVLEAARADVAAALGCTPGELYFTASGTEGNNIAVLGAARARKNWANRVVVTGYEHPSVEETIAALADEGFAVTVVNPSRDGRVDPDAILDAVDSRTALVAAMHVNNETGAMLDVSALARRIKDKNKRTAVHCDNVHGFLKHPLALEGIDTVSISAHKIHGPKGIGALYIRKNFNLRTPVHGGGQEKGIRSGTENVPLAAGFAQAVGAWGSVAANLATVGKTNRRLRDRLSALTGIVILSPDDASPYILNLAAPGFKSETVMHFLEARDIYVSSGSACSRGDRSHTLQAMGVSEALADGALRVSFTAGSTVEDADAFADALADAVSTLIPARR